MHPRVRPGFAGKREAGPLLPWFQSMVVIKADSVAGEDVSGLSRMTAVKKEACGAEELTAMFPLCESVSEEGSTLNHNILPLTGLMSFPFVVT